MTTACPTPAANPEEVEALYPNGSVPEIRFDKLSALCSIGQTPLIMTGALRQILVQHFCNAENVRSASLRSYLQQEGAWTSEANTGLYIESLARWRPELTEARPALLLKEGGWRHERVTIGNQAGVDACTGTQGFLSVWHGTHTIFALGKQGAETQVLATEVAKLLVFFGPLLADQLSLHRFQLTAIGELAAVQEATEHYVVPVSCEYLAEERWNLTIEAPRLKQVRFQVADLIL